MACLSSGLPLAGRAAVCPPAASVVNPAPIPGRLRVTGRLLAGCALRSRGTAHLRHNNFARTIGERSIQAQCWRGYAEPTKAAAGRRDDLGNSGERPPSCKASAQEYSPTKKRARATFYRLKNSPLGIWGLTKTARRGFRRRVSCDVVNVISASRGERTPGSVGPASTPTHDARRPLFSSRHWLSPVTP